jgi:hypothetical protein
VAASKGEGTRIRIEVKRGMSKKTYFKRIQLVCFFGKT